MSRLLASVYRAHPVTVGVPSMASRGVDATTPIVTTPPIRMTPPTTPSTTQSVSSLDPLAVGDVSVRLLNSRVVRKRTWPRALRASASQTCGSEASSTLASRRPYALTAPLACELNFGHETLGRAAHTGDALTRVLGDFVLKPWCIGATCRPHPLKELSERA